MKFASAFLLLSSCLGNMKVDGAADADGDGTGSSASSGCAAVIPDDVKSVSSTTTAKLKITNTLSYPVRFIWLNFEGEEAWTLHLTGGAQTEVNSYDTHSWLARAPNDARLEINGECVYTVNAVENDTSVDLTISASEDNPGAPDTEMICPPLAEGVLKSKESKTEVKVSFTNDATETIQALWIDFNGTINFYSANIEPGQSMEFSTFETHVWIAVKVSDYTRLSMGGGCSYNVNGESHQNVSITDTTISDCPSLYKDVSSKQSVVNVPLKMKNKMNEPVKLLWINFKGEVAYYWQVDANAERDISSYGTHPFIAVTLTEDRVPINQDCFYVTPAVESEQVLVLGGSEK